jgi:hypothetical protein
MIVTIKIKKIKGIWYRQGRIYAPLEMKNTIIKDCYF